MTANGAVWRNWGRSQSVRPRWIEMPASVGAVQRAVVAAGERGQRVKAVGSGHSFSGIALAPGVQIDLSTLSGLLDVDTVRERVTLAAGTPLHALPMLLESYGLALENMGDVDRQTVSGAISTGTHGTGSSFGGMATQTVALTLVTAEGHLLTISENENAELLPAARLGLGALGVIVDVTVQCVPAFVLQAVERPEPLDAVIEAFEERSDAADHFEFYWFPHTETALTKTNTRLPVEAKRHPLGRVSRWVDDEFVANGLYRAMCLAGTAVPAVIPKFSRLADKLTGNRDFTDFSPHVFVTNRGVRFREMEYALPRECVADALRELRALIERRGWLISFPVEVRTAASDDIWMSTAAGRATGYIAVHRYYREDPSEYFRAVEEIMVGFGGRPHWGKMHYLDAESLRTVYPHFDDFVAVRDRLDPGRLFANAHLERVLGA